MSATVSLPTPGVYHDWIRYFRPRPAPSYVGRLGLGLWPGGRGQWKVFGEQESAEEHLCETLAYRELHFYSYRVGFLVKV